MRIIFFIAISFCVLSCSVTAEKYRYDIEQCEKYGYEGRVIGDVVRCYAR